MKKLLFLVLFTSLLTYSQELWNVEDSTLVQHYNSPKYCNTYETFEDALNQWTWNANVSPPDCIQPGEAMANALYNEKTGNVNLYLLDSYDCCCKVASTPGSPSTGWTGFIGSPCETYLNSINWNPYNDLLSINEKEIQFKGIYIDMFGRQYTTPPKGLSIMNNKKYYRL